MASISISICTGNGTFEVALDVHETIAQAWSADKSYLDHGLGEAVRRISRAYGGEQS